MRPKLICATFLLAALTAIGCAAEERLYDVAGTVNYDGKPIPKGVIHFEPDVTKGETGQAGFANIVNGQFTTAKEGKGVRGGAYVVRVNGFDGKEAAEAPFGQWLFPEHTEKRDLPAANSELTLDIKKVKK